MGKTIDEEVDALERVLNDMNIPLKRGLSNLSLWGRVSIIVDERDALRAENKKLREALTDLIIELNEHHTVMDLHKDVLSAIAAGNFVIDHKLKE